MTKARDVADLLANGTVDTNELADGLITTAKLADNSVTTAKIPDAAITAAKLDVQGSDIPYDNTTSGISANTLQEAIDYLNVLSGGGSAGAQATYTRDNFTATAGQTVFTTSNGYTLGYVQVFMNGVLLAPSDFTANDESTVVLTVGASAGDEISVVAYDSFAISEVLRVLSISPSAPADSLAVDASGNIVLDGFFGGAGIAFRDGFQSSDNHKIYAGEVASSGRNGGIRISAYDGVAISTGSNDYTPRLIVDMQGRVKMPYQPAFRASFSVSSPTPYTAGARVLNFTDVGHNIGGHYDGTNKFTAPVAGLYRFSCDRSLNTYGINQVIRHPNMSFKVNGVSRHSVNTAVSVTDVVSTSDYTHFVVNMGTELYLNVGDYVQVEFNFNNSPSTLHEYATSYFSGYLIG